MYAMPLVGLLTAPLALYVRTGIPAARALAIGATNAFGSTTVVAMPSEVAAIAEFSELTIVGTVGCVEVAPVQVGVAMPSSAAASANPYWVGVKNALSVTWLTKVNFHEGVFGKFPATFFAVAALLLLPDEQAASRAAAAADALTSPVPSISLRRVTPSLMFSVSIASSTFGSILFLICLPPGEVPQCSARHHVAARRKADVLPSPWAGQAEPAVSQASKRSQTPERGKAPGCPALQGSPRKLRSRSEPPALAASLVLDSMSVFRAVHCAECPLPGPPMGTGRRTVPPGCAVGSNP